MRAYPGSLACHLVDLADSAVDRFVRIDSVALAFGLAAFAAADNFEEVVQVQHLVDEVERKVAADHSVPAFGGQVVHLVQMSLTLAYQAVRKDVGSVAVCLYAAATWVIAWT